MAQGWHPQGSGSCRRGPRLGHRGCSSGPQAQGHIHSLAGSGPQPPALLQSGPRCTAEHRPLLGKRKKRSWAQFLVAKAWCAVPQLTPQPRREGARRNWCPLRAPGSAPLHTPPTAPLCPQRTGREDRHTTLIALLISEPPLQGEGIPCPEALPTLQVFPGLYTEAQVPTHQSSWGGTGHTAGSRPRRPGSSILCMWCDGHAGVGCIHNW